MRSARILLAGLMLVAASSASANLINDGTFDNPLNPDGKTSINGSTGPFGEWLAFTDRWTISSGAAANFTPYAENPDQNYLMMQGIDISGTTMPFDSILSFDYFYENGYGGLDGRGVRLFGMESGDTATLFAPFSSAFSQVTLLFSQELTPTGDPDATGATFQNFTSGPISIDTTQYSALLLAFTFGGSSNDLRAVDNVSLSGPTSVPEPSTLALMAAGLLGIGFARRKKV